MNMMTKKEIAVTEQKKRIVAGSYNKHVYTNDNIHGALSYFKSSGKHLEIVLIGKNVYGHDEYILKEINKQ